MTSVEITKASFEDLKAILLLQKQAFVSEADIYNDFDISPPLLQTLEELTKEFSESIILKALLGDDIIGSVRGFQVDETVFIKRLIVNPHYQNQGIGTKLMKSIEDSFKDKKDTNYLLVIKVIEIYICIKRIGYKEFKQIPIHENLTMIYLEKYVSCR